MTHYNYERLSGLDKSFLAIEGPSTLMHVGVTAIFEPGPITTADGGVDIERITQYINSRLPEIPRYRQRLAYIPVEGQPVWVDDACFNIQYHVRHTSLPRPGDERRLKRLVARIKSQELDRGKPLWEIWIVEGLSGGRFAMVSKVHHCMIDGVSGVDLLEALLRPKPDASIPEPVRWMPRPAPTPLQLLRDEMLERVRVPFHLATRLVTEPGTVITDMGAGPVALAEAAAGLHVSSETPLNQAIGPQRRFDWAAMDLARIKEVKQHFGSTVNDVVLAIVTGAVRRFLQRRTVKVEDIDFRVFVPVSMRKSNERGTMGNHVAGWFVDLPVAERDPRKRMTKVHEATAHLKESNLTRGAEILTEVADWTGSTVIGLAMRLAAQARPFNLVVTNVPGPQTPLYLLGARLLEIYPLVPLFVNQGLGVALFSYAGQLFWGFNADWDVVPDLHDFVGAVETSFAELCAAASPGVEVKDERKPARRSRPRQRTRPDRKLPAHVER